LDVRENVNEFVLHGHKTWGKRAMDFHGVDFHSNGCNSIHSMDLKA
jgi:hypothetical protein